MKLYHGSQNKTSKTNFNISFFFSTVIQYSQYHNRQYHHSINFNTHRINHQNQLKTTHSILIVFNECNKCRKIWNEGEKQNGFCAVIVLSVLWFGSGGDFVTRTRLILFCSRDNNIKYLFFFLPNWLCIKL